MDKTSIILDSQTRRIGDFYAACILLKRFPQINEVRLGDSDMRQDDDIAIGLGGKFEPSDMAMSFDVSKTHRNGPGNPLGLVLTYLGFYDTASYIWPWLYPLEIKEAHGTAALVDHLNCGHEVLGKLATPLEAALFEDFLMSCPLTEDCALFGEMLRYGEFLIEQIIAADAIDGWVKHNALIVEVDDIKVMTVLGNPPDHIEQAVNRLMLRCHPEAACSVIHDSKGEGLTFFRFSFHHAKLDFAKAQHEPEVCYCNLSGSLLKTARRYNGAECNELITRIIRKAAI